MAKETGEDHDDQCEHCPETEAVTADPTSTVDLAEDSPADSVDDHLIWQLAERARAERLRHQLRRSANPGTEKSPQAQ
jgi:hypothetical protein